MWELKRKVKKEIREKHTEVWKGVYFGFSLPSNFFANSSVNGKIACPLGLLTTSWFVFLVRLNVHLSFFVLYFIFKKKKTVWLAGSFCPAVEQPQACSFLAWICTSVAPLPAWKQRQAPDISRFTQERTWSFRGTWGPCGTSWPTWCTWGEGSLLSLPFDFPKVWD